MNLDFNRLYLTTDGRIGRAEFWIGLLILAAVAVVVTLIVTLVLGPLSFAAKLIIFIVELIIAYPCYALFAKRFLEDPETGVTVRMVRYPAGFTNSWHTHPCAHGMFVLEGTLVTHQGSFGPGNFVWFPQGMTMEHGATQREDVTVLFLTNKRFEIHYVQR